MIRVLALVGPTAVGKTALALEIAEAIGGEIVSADSVQVYRGMDIGSAKPTPDERARVAHHLIDVADPDEPFSAGRYASLAAAAIEDVAARGKRPLLVGGSGLYIRALLQGLVRGIGADPAVRARIAARAAREGVGAIRARLSAVDPDAARRIHANDAYRMTRALEVYERSGVPLSRLQSAHAWRDGRFETVWIGLTEERPDLYARIEARCEAMVTSGLLEEVRGLVERGYGLHLRPLQSLGYKQMGDVLRGAHDLDAAVAAMKQATRRYAKRQLTWFRPIEGIAWFSPARDRAAILARAAGAFAPACDAGRRTPG